MLVGQAPRFSLARRKRGVQIPSPPPHNSPGHEPRRVAFTGRHISPAGIRQFPRSARGMKGVQTPVRWMGSNTYQSGGPAGGGSREADLSEHGPAGHVDERPRLLQATLDRSPLRHEDLELRPGAPGLVASKRDHPGPAGADSVELGPVVLDAAVPSDDQPPLTSSLRNPVLVTGGRAGDGTVAVAADVRRRPGLRDRSRRIARIRSPWPDRAHLHRSKANRRRPLPWVHAAACREFS
jgi:hypothetical protein